MTNLLLNSIIKIYFLHLCCILAEVVKLVDTHVSEACGASHAGSSPAFGTLKKHKDPYFYSKDPLCLPKLKKLI